MDTYEKKYIEALKRAKKLYEQGTITESLSYVFPELKESEDEKTRKEIIQFVRMEVEDEIVGNKWLAWLEQQGDKDKLIKELGEYKVKYTQEVLSQQLEKQGEKKHKFIIGDIISNNNVIYRVDNIVKNCIGQDCYFLVNVKREKDGTRYLKIIDSKGKTHNCGEITWVCEQVDAEFEKQGNQKSIDSDILIQQRVDALADIVAEQTPADKVKPKFKNGQWIVWNNKNYKVNYNGCGYELIDQDGLRTSLEYRTVNESAHLWTIKDAKGGAVLFYRGNVKYSDRIKFDRILLFENLDKSFFVLTKYSNGAENYDINANIDYPDNIIPATKEQKEILFMVMKEAGYKWKAETKELIKISTDVLKESWSKEDERICNGIICDIAVDKTMCEYDVSRAVCDKRIAWLKQLKYRIGG